MDFLAMMVVDVLLILSDDAQMQKALDAKTPVTVATTSTAVTTSTTSTLAVNATKMDVTDATVTDDVTKESK